MKRVLITAALALGLGTVGFAQDKAQVDKGMKVYTDQKCSLCHSIGGHGNAKGPLDGVGAKLKADEIRQWITDAKGMAAKTKAARTPAMKQYTLPKDEVDALVAYLGTLKEPAKK